LEQSHGVFRPAKYIEFGRPKGDAKLAGVLIHGRYRTPEEMVYFASQLDVDNIRWIAPAAGPGRSWYPGVFMDPIPSNEPFLSQAIRQVDYSLGIASEHGRIPPERLVMMGFSQGACLTAEYARRHAGRCETAIILTGGLFGPDATEWTGTPGMLDGTRALITGSDVDEWIPEPRVHETAAALRGFGAQVETLICKGRPHEVTAPELAAASHLIRSRLS
jgi:phospholipase/carboxylesterase